MTAAELDLGGLEGLLTTWMPTQRWFASKHRGDHTVQISARRSLLDGDPALVHLLAEVRNDDTAPVTYQLFIGVRRELPANLEHALIGQLGDASIYDATHDDDLMQAVVGWVAGDETRAGIDFRHQPYATIESHLPSMVIGGEQSNTSVVYGDQTIMKVFRIVLPGLNPDLEITRALTAAGNVHIAALQGWIETDDDGVPSTLGVLQEFLRTGSDGWALALTSVRDLFAEGDLHADEVGGDFAGESERLGIATADVHEAMAHALPTAVAGHDALAELAEAMRARLGAAVLAVPDLDRHASAITAVFGALASLDEPVDLQRVHGDLHLGQVMRTDTGWAILDFEGEPGAAIATRTALSSPIRDVAGMLRSFDYASRFLLADAADTHPAQLEYRAAEWAERNRDAFCNGYAKGAGHDPRDSQILLRAFELDKAVYEVVYESRHRPGWVGIPLGSIERLLAA